VKRKTKIIVSAMSICVGVAAAVVSVALFSLASGWPQRVPSESFTRTKPNAEEIAGTYLLKGQSCQLDLNPDGTFQVTNYPNWNASARGRWEFVAAGTTYSYGTTPQQMWGIQLKADGGEVDTLDLTGKAAPYGLVKLHAEADEGAQLTFEKKK
jgi:hypothetical protein